MNTFISNIITRHTRPANQVIPRVLGRFETPSYSPPPHEHTEEGTSAHPATQTYFTDTGLYPSPSQGTEPSASWTHANGIQAANAMRMPDTAAMAQESSLVPPQSLAAKAGKVAAVHNNAGLINEGLIQTMPAAQPLASTAPGYVQPTTHIQPTGLHHPANGEQAAAGTQPVTAQQQLNSLFPTPLASMPTEQVSHNPYHPFTENIFAPDEVVSNTTHNGVPYVLHQQPAALPLQALPQQKQAGAATPPAPPK
ncbi:hypothetical protein [Filimonas lacunae]|uniref:hypothetical protein n=1 Tax=Filimonas lacunae TaxID=477680 RepID=UPI0007D71E2D|nr:hypothetical protein [Filimonas lacunae]BAV06605.1 hypothetical protein FLA_2624 [Filimonas lacunae]